ncbi:hypothetical protein AB0M29_19425 [Streptomyces sp. NPDC051976]|uniref:hypothetical protein n=1 Tax=Streptomyces sp. NPDC051976 TaxID=3154947 RepID=UPI0034254C0C
MTFIDEHRGRFGGVEPGTASIEERRVAFILAVCKLCAFGVMKVEEFETSGYQFEDVLLPDRDMTAIEGFLDQVLLRNRYEQPEPVPDNLTE